MNWFEKLIPSTIRTSGGSDKKNVPEGLWAKCTNCDAIIYRAELERNQEVCTKCDFHMRIGARRRLGAFFDEDSPTEIAADLESEDILKFKDDKRYRDRLQQAQKQTGEKDAFGHRKLGGVGQWTAQRVKEITGHKVTYQQLGYTMRCGAPDSLDRMVAMNFGNLAMDTLLDGHSGVMTALQEGRYTTVGLDTITEGLKRVDVDRFYDIDEYRPLIRRVKDLPMFLK